MRQSRDAIDAFSPGTFDTNRSLFRRGAVPARTTDIKSLGSGKGSPISSTSFLLGSAASEGIGGALQTQSVFIGPRMVSEYPLLPSHQSENIDAWNTQIATDVRNEMVCFGFLFSLAEVS